MADAQPVTVIHGAQPGWRDDERDDSAEADGFLTGVLVDFDAPQDNARYKLDFNNGTLTPGNETIRPAALAVPITYDDAGVDFPAGSLLLIGGLERATEFLTLATDGVISGSSPMTMRKHFVQRWLVVIGLPAATTGTVKIQRTADWQAGVPSVDEFTVSIDGADGSEQWILLPDISAPADQRRSISLYYLSTWTGTAPKKEYVTATAPPAIAAGRVCPSTLPVGYTQEDDPQCENFGAPFWSRNARWRARNVSCPALSPLNRGFTRTISTASLIPNAATAYGDGLGMRLGQPSMLRSDTLPCVVFPCLWDGDALKEHSWMPWCSLLRDSVATQTVSRPGAGTTTGAYVLVDGAPGWREVTAWGYSASNPGFITSVTMEFARTADWSAGAPTVTIGSLTWTGAEATGIEGTVKRYGSDITPSPDRFDSYLYMRVILVSTGLCAVTCDARSSRRCDIPPPWPAAGVAGVIPGGNVATLLASPTDLGLVAHGGPGDTVASFNHPGGSVYRNYIASFLPPSNGVWKGLYSVSAGTAATCGEYEQLVNRRSSHLGRAGSRFWACVDQVLNGGGPRTDTLTLTTVAQVTTVVPSGAGLTVNSGHLTDGHWGFFTVALPAAGSYRIHLEGSPSSSTTAGPSVLFAVSLTDPYVVQPDTTEVREWYPVGAVVSETATPPGSPSHQARYLIATGATGAWAGEDGNIAQWDRDRSGWRFLRPDYARYGYTATQTTPSAVRWRDPGAGSWKTGAAEIATITVAVDAAATLYVRLGKNDPDGFHTSDSVLSAPGLGSVRIYWEAV